MTSYINNGKGYYSRTETKFNYKKTKKAKGIVTEPAHTCLNCQKEKCTGTRSCYLKNKIK